jgi:hypothetical protein
MKTTLLSSLVLGFLLGLRHATDPDHVVAVTTIVSRERRLLSSSLIGALWGLGHTATIAVVGGAMVVFDVVIPPRLGLAMELAVALMLIALGAANLGTRASASRGLSPRMAARPVFVGIVHGLAGSAAVAILVLSTIHRAQWALVYLLLFGLGTVAGMMLMTTAIALPFAYTARRFAQVNGWLGRATGLASILLGTFIVYHLTTSHGLFSTAPQWTPE